MATAANARRARMHVWPDETGEWWWNLTASNGRVLVTGDKGYSSKRNAVNAAERTIELIREEQFLLVDDEAGAVIAVAAAG